MVTSRCNHEKTSHVPWGKHTSFCSIISPFDRGSLWLLYSRKVKDPVLVLVKGQWHIHKANEGLPRVEARIVMHFRALF